MVRGWTPKANGNLRNPLVAYFIGKCTSHLGFGACLIRPQMDLPERDLTTNPPAMGIKGKGRQDNQLAVVLATMVLARFTAGGTGAPVSGYAMYATESAG